ncbi:hypothetical protein MNBD_NITROSPINAE01-1802 [hydrothermal vent metagenome]|uniref:Glycosyltransferase n=1 Tax=hydrothermal vent metagenome TaxID=652676 RepID=A0A3B1BLB4_9ZZZZ
MKTLIIFAKAPVLGFVKTRLLKNTPLNEGHVCALYEAFLKDTVTMSALTCADVIAIHFTPAEEEKKIRKLVAGLKLGARNEKRFKFVPQGGETFSQRIINTFETEKQKEGELVMIGADSPLTLPATIDDAFDFIYSRSGVAVGPSGEGGFYLFGFPHDVSFDFNAIFANGSELENLVFATQKLKLPLKTLKFGLDVDVEADLVTLLGLVRCLEYSNKFESGLLPLHTGAVIKSLVMTARRTDGDTRLKKISLSQEIGEA